MPRTILDLVGRTPIVDLVRVVASGRVIAKVEGQNPSGSVKDRPALAMIEAAEAEGAVQAGSVSIEATSGNTGIALAMICAVRGYRCVLVMPDNMSVERRTILRAYGAEIVLTAAEEGMVAAVAEAEAIAARTPGAFIPRQFENLANPEAHARATAREILGQVPDLAAFVAGVGTGGTLTGVGRVLRAERPDAKVIAVEPARSAVLSGGAPALHAIQGIGAGFVPSILDRSVVDEIITVSDVAAETMTRRLAKEEGLLVGTSSGANVHAACIVAARVDGPVVTMLCDSGERYLFG
ncbi:MAG: cysteine synthase A [Labilithrix sp.]